MEKSAGRSWQRFGVVRVFIPTAFIVGFQDSSTNSSVDHSLSPRDFGVQLAHAESGVAALLLKAHDAKKDRFTRAIDFAFGGFSSCLTGSLAAIGRVWKARHAHATVECDRCCGLCWLIGLTILGFSRVPQDLFHADKGYLVSFAQLPNGANTRSHGRCHSQDVRHRMKSGSAERRCLSWVIDQRFH